MTSATVRDQLRTLRFVDGLTDTAIHQLAKLVTPATFESDQLLFEEGAARTFVAILLSGAVSIEKRTSGRHVRLVTLGVGEAVGEGILLDDTPHGTSARALQHTEAFLLTREQVEAMVKDFPTLYAALVGRAARAISQRLAATDATLAGHGRVLGFSGARTRLEKDLLGERECFAAVRSGHDASSCVRIRSRARAAFASGKTRQLR